VPSTAGTSTDGGAVIRKPGSAWLEGTPAIHVTCLYVSWCVRVKPGMGVESAYYGQIHEVGKSLSKSRNGRGGAQMRRVGGWTLAMRRREVAVQGQEPPGRANLRVFRCKVAKSRVWQLATWARARSPALHKARPAEGRPLPPDT